MGIRGGGIMAEDNGLVFGYLLDGSGGGRAVSWAEAEAWKPGEGTLWIHLDYENEKVRGWLSDKSGIPQLMVEALVEEDTRPRALPQGDAMLLIMRGVNMNPGAEPEDMVALRMWYEKDRVITMRHRKVMAIDDIRRAIEAGKGPDDSSEFMTMAANRLADRLGDVVSDIDDTVGELEDSVLVAESGTLRASLSEMRRKCIKFRRYMAPQRDMLARLQGEKFSWLGDAGRARLREVAERTARYIEDIDAARDRASITHEELNNRLAERMNKTMYLLSIVAAIFLPLGLITGLLGINVGGIPGTNNNTAFAIVAAGLVVIAFLEYLLFKKKKML